MDGVTERDKERFYKLVKKARQQAEEGQLVASITSFKLAYDIFPSEKVKRRITKIEAFMKENDVTEEKEEEDSTMVQMKNGFVLYKEIYDRLYRYQVEGVQWLHDLHQKRTGGILGDDMGLGKTIQVIGFLSGMFDAGRLNSVLIVMPVSLIPNWEKEFDNWAPGIIVHVYHGSSKKEKERALDKVQRRGGVLMTTYGTISTSWEELSNYRGKHFTWDVVILDEGHKIKNPTKTAKAAHAISARTRFVLSGTPLQNDLRELWALYDFVQKGALLGTMRTFMAEYGNIIKRSREKDATPGEKRLGEEMAQSLRQLIRPYFLRRTKADVNMEDPDGNKENRGNEKTHSLSVTTVNADQQNFSNNLPQKNEFIVWLFLTDVQQKIYQDFLALDQIKELLMTSRSPLVELTVLKKLCDHPRLLSRNACAQLGLDGESGLDMGDTTGPDTSPHAMNMKIDHVSDFDLTMESGKFVVLFPLLDQLKADGHRTLFFSQSRKILDIVERILQNKGYKLLRLDGTISKPAEREILIQKFQKNDHYSVFLLTTQVGGVGLTLTAADRVVVFDPSWNPAIDAQAVDRAYRIGQTRYFSRQELFELFTLDDPHFSNTQKQLEELHTRQRKTYTELDEHIAFLYSLDIFGISDHDLMFSQQASKEELEGAGVEEDYIQARVQKALSSMQTESDLNVQLYEENQKNPNVVATKPKAKSPVHDEVTTDLPTYLENTRNTPLVVLDDLDDAEQHLREDLAAVTIADETVSTDLQDRSSFTNKGGYSSSNYESVPLVTIEPELGVEGISIANNKSLHSSDASGKYDKFTTTPRDDPEAKLERTPRKSKVFEEQEAIAVNDKESSDVSDDDDDNYEDALPDFSESIIAAPKHRRPHRLSDDLLNTSDRDQSAENSELEVEIMSDTDDDSPVAVPKFRRVRRVMDSFVDSPNADVRFSATGADNSTSNNSDDNLSITDLREIQENMDSLNVSTKLDPLKRNETSHQDSSLGLLDSSEANAATGSRQSGSPVIKENSDAMFDIDCDNSPVAKPTYRRIRRLVSSESNTPEPVASKDVSFADNNKAGNDLKFDHGYSSSSLIVPDTPEESDNRVTIGKNTPDMDSFVETVNDSQAEDIENSFIEQDDNSDEDNSYTPSTKTEGYVKDEDLYLSDSDY